MFHTTPNTSTRNTDPMKTRLIRDLRDHGVDARASSKGIEAVEGWTAEGRTFSRPVTLAVNVKAIRRFLGY